MRARSLKRPGRDLRLDERDGVVGDLSCRPDTVPVPRPVPAVIDLIPAVPLSDCYSHSLPPFLSAASTAVMTASRAQIATGRRPATLLSASCSAFVNRSAINDSRRFEAGIGFRPTFRLRACAIESPPH